MILLVSYLDMVDAAFRCGRETRVLLKAWPVAPTIAAGLPH